MEAVSWKDVRATIHVREIDVQRQDKSWQIHDSAPTLVESDVASQKAFFDTGRFELTTGKQLGPPLLEVDWHVNVCQIVAGTLGGGAEADGGHYEACECWCHEAWRKGKHPE